MNNKIYSINFTRWTGDEFYFVATLAQVEKIEKETPVLVDSTGWDNDQDGRNFVARKNKHLFSYSEMRNKINIHENWGRS